MTDLQKKKVPSFVNDFQYDNTKAKGVWFKEDDCEFYLAHVPEITFLGYVSDAVAEYKLANDKEEISGSEATKISVEMVVKHRLLDWRNVPMGDGELEYSTEKAEEMLIVSQRFRDWVNKKAQNIENYYSDQRVEKVKKS